MHRSLLCGLTLLGVPLLACSSSAGDTPPPGAAGMSSLGGTGAAAGASGASAGLANSGSSGSGASGAPVGGGSSASGASGLSGAAGVSAGAGAGGNSAGGAGGAVSTGGVPGTLILRDNFDNTKVDGPPEGTRWLPPPSGSTNGPTIVSSKAHSAPNSASSTGTSSGQGAALIPADGLLPTADNHFYVRVWVNFAKATSAVMGHAAFLVAGSTLDQSGTELRLGVSIPPGFNTAMVDLNLQNPKDGGGGEVTRFSNGFTTGGNPLNVDGTTFAADTWICVEALFDGGHNEFRLWIGDNEVANMHVTNFAARPTDPARVMWAPSFKFLKIGAQNYSGDIGQVFYDDVVVSSAKVGCQ